MIEPAIDQESAIQASSYTADYINPTVIEFTELSLTDNKFTILFSEPILANTYIPSKFIIRSSENGDIYFRVLTGGEPDTDEVTDTLIVTFTKEDVSEIEKEVMLAFDMTNTFIEILDGAINDTANNPVIGTKDSENNPIAIQVLSHLKDTTGPELIDFSLDMDNGEVVLTFDDVVDPASFVPTEITFLASSSEEEDVSHRLTEGYTDSPIGFTVAFTLVDNDLNSLKTLVALATSENNTFISITSLVILEPGNVGALPLTLQCGNFTADTTSPRLVNFSYDAHVAALSLIFSEVVNISSLDPIGITLLNANNEFEATQSYTLEGGEAVPNISGISFSLYLTIPDLHILQEHTNLATSVNNSFISILNTTINDMADNPIEPISLIDALGAIDHDQDMLVPSLNYFSFDLNEGLLTLTFSEAVNTSSLNVSSFVLSNSANVDEENFQSYRIMDGYANVNDTIVSDHDVVVLLYISQNDLDEINKLTELATEKINTRLYYDSNAIVDAAGNGINERPVDMALFASDFINDTSDPQLIGFSVDLNDGTMTITFSETVDISTIDYTGITIVDHPVNSSFMYDLTNGTLTSGDGPVITFVMDTDDINYLKLSPQVFTNKANSYLYLESFALKDPSGNSVEKINVSSAKPATTVIPDITPPSIVYTILDLDSGNLTLTFNEPVLAATLVISTLNITDGNISYALTDNSTTSSDDGIVVLIEIGRSDLNAIKYLADLAVSQETSLLALTEDFIQDTSYQNIEPIVLPNATIVSEYIFDETPPEVIAFDLSMTDGVRRPMIMTVQFSETFDFFSVIETEFMLQAGPSHPEADLIPLSGAISLKQVADDTLEIVVLISDFEEIIELGNFLVSEETSYLSVISGAVNDTNNNPLVEIDSSDGLKVRSYGVDLVSPFPTNFSLDLDSGTISLTWSEPVILDTINETLITVQMNENPGMNQHMITDAEISYGVDSTTTNIVISDYDLNIIKANDQFGTNTSNTYLSISADAVLDLAENPSVAREDSTALKAFNISEDVTRPQLVSFDFMITTGILTMTFSESVNPDTIDPLGIILQNKNRQSTQSLRLTGGNTTTPPGTYIEWVLSNVDLDELKILTDLYTTEDNSYLSIAHYTLKDMSDNYIVTVPTSAAKQIASLNNDTKPPELRLFNLDLNARTLTLSFSETVNTSSLIVSGITLSNGEETSYYTLETSYTNDDQLPQITIQLSDNDFNAIVEQEICFIECFISIENGTVQDMSDNGIEEIEFISASALNMDKQSPSLIEFVEFDLNNGTMILSFSETVNPVSFNPEALTLQTLYTSSPLQSYQLTNVSYTLSSVGTSIEITLGHTDLIEIMKRQHICTHQGNCYVTITQDLIKDQSNNNVIQVASGIAPGLVAMSFISDVTQPELESFDFDAENGLLMFSFSETINPETIDPSGIKIQNYENSSEYYTLTGGTSNNKASDIVTFNITDYDFNKLRALGFANSKDTTYLSIDAFAIQDVAISPNNIEEIPITSAQQVDQYINDTSPPYITEFSLDFDLDQLSVTFSEPILLTSIDASQLMLVGNPDLPDINNVNLTGSVVVTDMEIIFPGAQEIILQLARDDLISIKTNIDLAELINNTYLRAYSGFVQDTAYLFSNVSDYIQVTDLIVDTTPTMLQSFSLDVNIGQMLLTFNDVVNVQTFDVASITIQDGMEAQQSYTLTSSSFPSTDDGYIVNITIGAVDLFQLKSITDLADSNETAYITMLASVVDDPYGVDVIAITDGKAIQVKEYTADTDEPMLEAFSLNMNTTTLSLTFSEGVNLSSLIIENLILYSSDDITDNTTESFLLMNGDLTQSDDGKVIDILLTTTDSNEIKSNMDLATSVDNTYLFVPAGTVKDLVGFELIVDINITKTASFTPDKALVMLLAFTIDMDAGLINLTFSETVNSSTINVSDINIQNRREFNEFTQFVTLDQSYVLDEEYSTDVTIKLSEDDLNLLKIYKQLAIDFQSAFIAVGTNVVQDLNNNPTVPVLSSNAIESDDLIPDITRPELTGFEFDRTPGIFTFTFSEVIDYEILFDFTQISIQNVNDSNSTDYLYYNLKDAGEITSTTEPYIPIYTVLPSDDDINNIKRILGLATIEDNTFLSVTYQTTQDYAGNYLVSIDSTSALQADIVYNDTVPPMLVAFDFDTDSGTVTLTFDEVVDGNTLNISLITFTSLNYTPNRNYTLTDSISTSETDFIVTIYLSDEDLDQIKLDTGLATTDSNTYILLEEEAIYDTSDNAIEDFDEPLQVSIYTSDTTQPFLTEYNISIDAGRLYLLFNEAVNFTSLDVTLLTLWSTSTGLGTFFRLTKVSYTSGPNDEYIIVEIETDDLNVIKDNTELAVSNETTVLAVRRPAILDMNMNQVENAHRVYDRKPSFFVEDSTRPVLDKFTINLNEGLIMLYFDETVHPDTFNITGIFLQNAANSPSSEYMISDSSNYIRTNYSSVLVNLSLSDLNAIKAFDDLATSTADTFITITNRTTEDRNNNYVVEITSNMAFVSTQFVNDTTDPSLVSFFIDFENATFTLSFTETIDTTTVNLSEITFTDKANSSLNYILFGGEYDPDYTDVITVKFLKVDRDEITRLDMCREASDCFIYFGSELLMDMSGNRVTPVSSSNPKMTDEFERDGTSTILVEFAVFDMDSGFIRLIFEETINVSTIDFNAWSVQNYLIAPEFKVFLEDSEILTDDNVIVDIQLNNDVLNMIKAFDKLCVFGFSDCHLRLTKAFIQDTFGNNIIPVNDSLSIQPNSVPANFTEDTTKPRLTHWDIDFTNENVTLYFSETVNYQTLDATAIIFQNSINETNDTVTVQLLQPADLYTIANEPYLSFGIMAGDIFRLKAETDLLTSQNTLYITFDETLVSDMNDNQIVPITSDDSLAVNNYTPDTILPTFEEFTQLDMDIGVLTLSFSEPIDLDTIIYSNFSLHDTSDGEASFDLTGGIVEYESSTHEVLLLYLNSDDFRSIKLLQDLAVDKSSSYLSFIDGAISDKTGNPIVAEEIPINVVVYIEDSTGPNVLNFTVDMDEGLLIITFDDVIDREIFQPQHITIQSESSTDPFSIYDLTSGSPYGPDGYEIPVRLSKTDLDGIKMLPDLATNESDTYLSLLASTARDVANNELQAIVFDKAIQTHNYIPDTTDPYLSQFILNLDIEVDGIDRGTLTLVFNEAINSSSLVLNQITLQSHSNISMADESYDLTGGDIDPSFTGVTIVVTLTKYDTDNLKEMTKLANNVNDTYISFLPQTVYDMARNPIIPIDDDNGTQAASLEQDAIRPELLGYCFDLDGGEPYLQLTFSETVNVTSIRPQAISLFSSQDEFPVNSSKLQGGVVMSVNDTVVDIYLLHEDANIIKQKRSLAISATSTYLGWESAMLSDNADNAIMEVDSVNAYAVKASCYTEDMTQPNITRFDFDATNNYITLYFSETVSILEFNFTGITFVSTSDSINSEQRQLTDGTLVTNKDSDIITFILDFDDINYITNITSLATNKNNTYIIVDNTTVFDMNNNRVTVIEYENALGVDNYTIDTENPKLVDFEFDLDEAEILLSFTETVNSYSLNVTQVTLHGGTDGPQFTLTETSYTNSPSGPEITISISFDDLNAIKKIFTLATNINNTFITITSELISDMSDNDVIPIDEPKIAIAYREDITRPTLVSFRLDMENTVPPLLIILTFSETVNVDSLDLTQFTLQINSTDTSDEGSFQLTDGELTIDNSTQVTITVNETDLESIRVRPPLAHYQNTSYLSITSLAIMDMAGLMIVPSIFNASENTADLVPPYLDHFTFDLDNGRIVLVYSENISVASFMLESVTIQDKQNDLVESLPLLNSTVTQITPTEIEIILTTEELNEVKRLTLLAFNENTTYVSLTPNSINDIAENDALPVYNTSAQKVFTYTKDTTRPKLEAFDFSLATKTVTLIFDETVNVSTFDPSSIILHSNQSSQAVSYQLTGGYLLSNDSTVVEFELTIADKNAIKQREPLAISNETLYMEILSLLISDHEDNAVNKIKQTDAISVRNFTPDLDRPSLLSFDVDMNQGILTLHFNETVNVNSIVIDNFTLQDNASFIDEYHTLTTSKQQETDSADVIIELSLFDLNEIKRKEFCYSKENCFLQFEEAAVYDMVSMPIDGIPDGQAVQVDEFTSDTTNPELAEFTSINLDDRTIRLSFSETINATSFIYTTITIMDVFNQQLANITLSGGSTDDTYSDVIEFVMEPSDVTVIKANTYLCVYRGNCYITFTSEFAKDMVGNDIVAVGSVDPVYAVLFYGTDMIYPLLNDFALDLENDKLILTFNEPVSVESLDATGIVIQGYENTSDSNYYHRLTGGMSNSEDGPIITIELLTTDVNIIKGSVFAKDINDTYLAIGSETIADTAFHPNQVVSISTYKAIMASSYTKDITPPFLEDFTLNLNEDVLTLTFNEPIDQRSVDCQAVTFVNDTINPIATVSLTGCIIEITDIIGGSKEIVLELTKPDIIAFKANAYIASNKQTAILSLTQGFGVDTANNNNEPITNVIGTLIEDETRPQLVSFDYDQLLGQIILTFSDVVDTNTFDSTAIQLQHDISEEEGRTFSPSVDSKTSSPNGYIVVLQLSHYDLLSLKSNTEVARNENDTYITFAASLVDDTRGVDVVPITDGKAVTVTTYVPDDVSPTLISYEVDMNSGQLTLSFSDTVNLTSFDVEGLLLLNTDDNTTDSMLRLNGDTSSRSIDGTSIIINITSSNLNIIKYDTEFMTGITNTYLAIDFATVYDLAVNPIEPIDASESFNPISFINDTTGPQILSFNLNMNTGTISLTFDETVNVSSIDETEFTIQNSMFEANQSYDLLYANSSIQHSHYVDIYLNQEDINSINRLRQLASTEFNTYLSVTADGIRDMNNNALQEIFNISALTVTNFTEDSTSPTIVSFELNINDKLLILTFDEVVDYESFNQTQLTLQNIANATEVNTDIATYTITVSDVRPIDDTFLTIDLLPEDLNAIKKLTNLATSVNDTYIFFTEYLVKDTFGNNIEEITDDEAIKVSSFSSDATPPVLTSFTLDVDGGWLHLTFDETVNASSFDISSVTIQSSSMSPIEYYKLQDSVSSQEDSTIITVYIDQIDLDNIKVLNMLAINENNTYLNLSQDTVHDMNGVSFEGIVQKAEFVEPDTSAPRLEMFVFDLNLGIVTLEFDEAVNVGSLNVSGLIFYASDDIVNEDQLYQLQSSSMSYNNNQKTINVTISVDDLNAIKEIYLLATEMNTTYLFISNDTIADMADNYIISLPLPTVAFDFIEDDTPPGLSTVTFNYNNRQLTLVFTETVDVTSFDPKQITFLDSKSPPCDSLDINGGTFSNDNSTTIYLTLLEEDVNKIKEKYPFFSDSTKAYVIITNDTIQDMSSNDVVPVTKESAKNVNPIITDDASPEIETFDLDMNEGLITIYFSESVNRETLTLDEFHLQNTDDEPSQDYQLESYEYVAWSLTHVVIKLSTNDLNEIKLLSDLATNDNTTYIRYTQSAVSDHASNQLIPRNVSNGLMVQLYTPDTTNPEVVSFILDFDGSPQILMLSFNEPVQNNSVDFESITLQSKENITDSEYHILTGGTVTTPNGLTVSIELEFIDVVTIQSLRNLATDDTNTYISLLNGTVLDMANNPSVEISDELADITEDLMEDQEMPRLEMFLFDSNSGVISLTFSEAIDYASFIVQNEVSLLNNKGSLSTTPHVTLSNYSIVSEEDWYIVNITLGVDDFNKIRIQAPYGLCTSAENCYIQIEEDSVKDTAGHYLDRIDQDNTIHAYDYIDDITEPYLESFTFDVRTNDAVLHLTFSEPVELKTFEYSSIEFHNSEDVNISSTIIPLTSGEPVPILVGFNPFFVAGTIMTVENTIQVDITLNANDLNLLKTYSDIATNIEDTFLFLYADTVKDYYNNFINEQSGITIQASEVLPDETHPYLDDFEFDLNEGQLKFVFSESMNASTLDFSAITIQSSSTEPLYQYTLMDGENSLDNIRAIIFNITTEDLNAIKKIRGLATRMNNTYISFLSDGIYDMAGLNLTEISLNEGEPTSLFSPDITSPLLESFTLNLTDEILSLTFDETVSSETLIQSRLTLQSLSTDATISLTDTSSVSENDSTVIDITLSTNDLNRIKLNTDIGVSIDTTQLVISPAAIEDMAKQPNVYQLLNASDFYQDTVRPELLTFLFDLNTGLIILNFNEAIKADSVDESLITFLNAPNGSVLFNPQNLTTNSTNGPQLRLRLTTDDLNDIKKNTSLLSAMYNSYVNIYSGFVSDMNDYPVEETLGVVAVNVTDDSTRPQLDTFDFDLNIGTLVLYFTETVNASTFNAVGITLQSQLFADESDQHQLSGGFLESLIDDTVLTFILTDDDLNDIKAFGIALYNDTTWLTMKNLTIEDMSGNLVTPIVDSTNALNVDVYTDDDTSPELLNFTLDLTHEILTLTFSETVDVYTVNTTQITLLNSNNDYSSSNYTLSSSSYQSSEHGPIINITLDDYDLNEIKKLTDLGTSPTNTYLALTSNAIADRSGNPVVTIGGDASIPARDVISDIHQPILTEFLFDLNEGQMLLTFTETVNATSILLSQFALLSSNDTNDAIVYNLTGGSVLSMDGDKVLVEFSFYDLNEIKLLRDLATGSNNYSNNTFLIVESTAVTDNEGNILVGIYDTPLPATQFVSDITKPELDDFHLDLNTGSLTLIFTEAVDGETLNPEDITLLNTDTDDPETFYTLTNGSVISVEQNWIEVNLTVSDLDEIKARFDLATTMDNTYISIKEGAILDTSSNSLVLLNLTDALPVNILTPDITSPSLIAFMFDLDSGEMNLTYSETVIPSTLTTTAFTVQNAMSQLLSDTNLYYTFKELQATVIGYDNTIVSVVINNIDLNAIKSRPDIATSKNNTYLSFTKDAINDTSMNSVIPRYPSNAIQASEYIEDTTPPELAGFDFDLNNGQLTFRFTETVNRTTLVMDNFVFKSDNTSNETTNYTLTGDDSSFVP